MKGLLYKGNLFFLCCFSLFCLYGCNTASENEYKIKLPLGFPELAIPSDNKITKERIELGRKLFFDPELSKDGKISCASCHIPENAFSDTVALSRGFHGRFGFRNAPSLGNVAYNKAFFRDGGSPTLEMQVISPIEDSSEMNINFRELVDKIKNEGKYKKQSIKAYGRDFDGFVLSRSIASFQRTLLTGNSKYDRMKRGAEQFSMSEKRGEKLFYSNKTNCGSCHSGFNFTNYKYENIGLKKKYRDSGRMRITLKEEDRNKFIVPSLRNVEVTSPYMFDGSIKTLEAVIDFFDSGGYPSKTSNSLIKPLNLSSQDKKDLINFLKTLTDDEFLRNKKFKQ